MFKILLHLGLERGTAEFLEKKQKKKISSMSTPIRNNVQSML